jgi:hypothetical protein
MCGLAVADEDDPALRAAVQTCRAKLGVPANKALHWQEHAKKYSRRQYVAAELSALPLVVNYVIFEKAAIPAASRLWKALIPDEFGGYEQHHLLAVSHQIRRRNGRARGYGFKVIGRPGCMESYPCWPASGL